jgi:hypothetical protein
MRIDIVVEPSDLFETAATGVDVEASGHTFAAELTAALGREFPEARLNVWFSPTRVASEGKLETHWDDGEIDPERSEVEENRIQDRVRVVTRAIRDRGDWIVRTI